MKNSRHQLTNSLQESLTRFRKDTPQFVQKVKPVFRTNLPNLDNIGVDGVDHINIWENGTTELGVALSHTSDIPFTHCTYGKFRSVEGFWHYIRSINRDDRCRMYFGNRARVFGKSLEAQQVRNFREIIMDANWQKIKTYPPLVEEIKNSDAPFDSYYSMGNGNITRARAASAFWLIEGFEEIRCAIKEGRSPNFAFLHEPGTPALEVPAAPIKHELRTRNKGAALTSRLTKTDTAPEHVVLPDSDVPWYAGPVTEEAQSVVFVQSEQDSDAAVFPQTYEVSITQTEVTDALVEINTLLTENDTVVFIEETALSDNIVEVSSMTTEDNIIVIVEEDLRLTAVA